MSTPWESPIIRVSTGLLNSVNDTVIGGQASIGSRSRYAGQLGKHIFFGAEQINQMFNPSVLTLYPGRFRYVRLREDDDASPALGIGKLVFWDTTVTSWQTAYQVTRDENLSSSDNAVMIAGVYIGSPSTNGNYGFIQDGGMVNVRFRSVLTAAGAVGSRVYAAGAGDLGADQGTADVLTTDSTSLANARYLGRAVTAPSASGLSTILLDELRFGVL
jgi:hypothetical protein